MNSHSGRTHFDQGQVPTIACFNQATEPLGVDFDKLLAALQKYVDQYFCPVWGTPAKLVKTTGFIKDTWAMAFLDDADAPNALAYHDLTPQGLPLAKVFVKTALANGEQVSVAASHELAEMLVDPAINLYSLGPKRGQLYAYESADPVEGFSFEVDGIPVSDFIYPSYFEGFRKPGSTKFDYLGKLDRPFQIDKAGYQIVWSNGKQSQLFGSARKRKLFAKEDRRGHRGTYRNARRRRPSRAKWGKLVARYFRQRERARI